MAGSNRPLLRRRGVVVGMLIGAAAVTGFGAVAWSRTVADDRDLFVLDQPGEIVDPAATNEIQAGNRMPGFDLIDADGDSVRLESDGRPLVVNLWYSTCPPCARELAAFSEVEGEVGGDVRFVGVNPFDSNEDMMRFATERGVDYELLRDPDFAVGNELGVVQFPVTLFVNADGEIIAQTGALSESELRGHVAELLG